MDMNTAAMGRRVSVSWAIALAIAAWILPGCAAPGAPPVSYTLSGDTEFGISFMGFTDERTRAHVAEHLEPLGVTHTRLEAEWGFREPSEGAYRWGPMDERMAFLEEQRLTAVITIPADAPEWLRNRLPAEKKNERSAALDADGRDQLQQFVTDFLVRYGERHPGLVRYVQFGNEWASSYNYAGTGEDFRRSQAAFYEAVKSVDPSITVVLGGFSVGWLAGLATYDGTIDSFWDSDGSVVTRDDLLAELDEEQADYDAGRIAETSLSRVQTVLDDAKYDWVDAHLYDQYEDFAEYVEALRSRLPESFTGRVVVTEFGGPHPVRERGLSDGEHAEMVERYIEAIDPLDVEFALHFRLVRSKSAVHDRSGLMRRGLFGPVPLPAFEVFGRINAPDAWGQPRTLLVAGPSTGALPISPRL